MNEDSTNPVPDPVLKGSDKSLEKNDSELKPVPSGTSQNQETEGTLVTTNLVPSALQAGLSSAEQTAARAIRGSKANKDGKIGETRIELTFLEFQSNEKSFDVAFLGDKAEGLDFFIRLQPGPGFFFLQVKSSGKKREPAQNLTVDYLTLDDFNALVEFPAPVYLVGMDLITKDSFIVAADNLRNCGTSTIRIDFPITAETLDILYNEVLNFWTNATSDRASSFPFSDLN